MSRDTICKWRKKIGTGRHTFHYGGQRYSIAPGDEVVCPLSALGSISVKYDMLSELPGQEAAPSIEESVIEKKNLVIVKVSRWLYNIINPDNPDKPLNDEPMKIAAAREMLGELEIVDPLEDKDWGQLVEYMEKEGIEILDEYETEADLRAAITTHLDEEE